MHQSLTVGYCMNVHPATDLPSVHHNLEAYAAAVRRGLIDAGTLAADEPLGIGLWLPDPVVQQLYDVEARRGLSEALQRLQLTPFTVNGFPQKNFHQEVVKHAVYEPTWWSPERLRYTRQLSDCLSELLPEDVGGSISTLPIAWNTPRPSTEQFEQAAENLRSVAEHLRQLEDRTGRQIVLAIEPEPGCVIGDCSSARLFFLRHLLKGPQAEVCRRYLTICHDVCHASVMREDQRQQIQAYRDCGIRIGKVQVSSAIHVDWDSMPPAAREEAFAQVCRFAEDRYLHQTTTRNGPVGSVRFAEDLTQLIEAVHSPERLVGNWTIHFHVPIQADHLGPLGTTRAAIDEVLDALFTVPSTPVSNGRMSDPVEYKKLMRPDWLEQSFTGHFEVETYAWSVMPDEYRRGGLVDDLVAEIQYFMSRYQSRLLPA